MKRITGFIGLVFIASIALSSCVRSDYKCVCNYKVNGQDMTYEYEYEDFKKKDALDHCRTLNVQYTKCELN